jgi:uncharacterized membrane protein
MQPSQTAPHAAAIVHAPEPPAAEPAETAPIARAVEKLIVWVGSITSLVLHTLAFIAFFAVAAMHMVGWDTMFLVLTTVVSLEAIYLSIFIQFSVNRQAASLKEVEENVEELGENVEELGESVEDIQVDVEELGEHVESIKEEIEEISEDETEEAAEDARKKKQAETLEALTRDVQALLQHLEQLKGR